MISDRTFILLSGALTFGAPLVFAVRGFIEFRRDARRRDEGPPPPRRSEPPSPPFKPLPDCLVPRPAVRQGELEDA